MAVEETYDANAKASERLPKTILIGDKTFHVKRNGWALKKIIEVNPSGEEHSEDELKENPGQNLDDLYQSIAYVLVDKQDEYYNPQDPETGHPDVGWLQAELDFEIAQDLLEKFVPRRPDDDGGQPGAAPRPPLRPVEGGAKQPEFPSSAKPTSSDADSPAAEPEPLQAVPLDPSEVEPANAETS